MPSDLTYMRGRTARTVGRGRLSLFLWQLGASVLSRKFIDYCIAERNVVMRAKAGIQVGRRQQGWIPACAGMTETGPRLFIELLTQGLAEPHGRLWLRSWTRRLIDIGRHRAA